MRKIYLAPIILVVLTSTGLWSGAAPNPKKVQQVKEQFISEGSLSGGQASRGSTLMDIRRTLSQNKKAERLVIALGDINGNRSSQTTYFHVQLDKNSKRLILDLAQTPNSLVDAKKLAQSIANSPFITKSDMTVDPEDRSLNMTFALRENVKMRAYAAKAKDGQALVVVDLLK